MLVLWQDFAKQVNRISFVCKEIALSELNLLCFAYHYSWRFLCYSYFFYYSSLLTLQYLLLTTQYLKVCYYIATLPHYTTLQHYYITTSLHYYFTTLLHYCITALTKLKICTHNQEWGNAYTFIAPSSRFESWIPTEENCSWHKIYQAKRAIFVHGWRNIHELSGQSNGTRSLSHSLTQSMLINLFIKLELNNFLLSPLLSIVFVQECSVVLRKVFDVGRLERCTFLPEKLRAWVRVCREHQRLKSTILVSCVFLS